MYNSCYNNISKKSTRNKNIQIISIPGLKIKIRIHNIIIIYNNCYRNIIKKNTFLTNYLKYLIANILQFNYFNVQQNKYLVLIKYTKKYNIF